MVWCEIKEEKQLLHYSLQMLSTSAICFLQKQWQRKNVFWGASRGENAFLRWQNGWFLPFFSSNWWSSEGRASDRGGEFPHVPFPLDVATVQKITDDIDRVNSTLKFCFLQKIKGDIDTMFKLPSRMCVNCVHYIQFFLHVICFHFQGA